MSTIIRFDKIFSRLIVFPSLEESCISCFYQVKTQRNEIINFFPALKLYLYRRYIIGGILARLTGLPKISLNNK